MILFLWKWLFLVVVSGGGGCFWWWWWLFLVVVIERSWRWWADDGDGISGGQLLAVSHLFDVFVSTGNE